MQSCALSFNFAFGKEPIMQSCCEIFNSPKNLVAVCILVFSSALFGQQGGSASSVNAMKTPAAASSIAPANPNQVAILRWYRANQTATFAVGKGPGQAAFDGSSIWVANKSSDTVTTLRASDGSSLGDFPAGSSPSGLVFDGASIWVADQGSSSVTQLRAGDGKALGSFTVGFSPFGVAFDGANIWVVNLGSNNVTKLRARDGKALGTFNVGASPQGIADRK